MSPFRSDEILWYNNGVWGELGYAVPNHGDDPATLNNTIAELVQITGRNLSAVMHHSDADLRTPPTINTLIRVHKLITRARSILAGRAVPENKARFEPTHATPAQEVFLIYPVPYFKVRSSWLKSWCGLILNALGEMMQHTDNRIEYEISTAFAGTVGQYLQRVYVRMATELFQVPIADAEKPDFALTEAHFQAYNPSKFFTATELIDTVPPITRIPTEDDLQVLTDGIPASVLVGAQPYPNGSTLGSVAAGSSTVAVSTTPAFVAPPGP